jgi:prepilin-type N-terminal cleavage/methylation domain-containing protein
MAVLLLNWFLMVSRAPSDGFSLVELLLVVAMIGSLAAVALPVMKNMNESIKLNDASRLGERELQDARIKAVSANRVLRVRMNCPTTGSIRRVEVLATAVDAASNRCLQSAYPFPAADTDVMTRPNFDGPVRTLPAGATVTSSVIQFAPDGTANEVVSGVPQVIATAVTLTITRAGKSKSVTINGTGKILLQ